MPTKKNPNFLDLARTFYGEAFEAKTQRELAEAMAEWEEMEPGEQSFATAHLLYLQLQAQAQTQQLLGHVRSLLDELAEAFTAAVVANLEQDQDEEPQSFDDEADEAMPEPMVIDAEPAPPEAA
jgi:predicted TPR repeat methyltransferase